VRGVGEELPQLGVARPLSVARSDLLQHRVHRAAQLLDLTGAVARGADPPGQIALGDGGGGLHHVLQRAEPAPCGGQRPVASSPNSTTRPRIRDQQLADGVLDPAHGSP